MSNANSRLAVAVLLIFGLAATSSDGAGEALDRSQMPRSEEQYTEQFGLDLYKRGLYPEAIAVWLHAFETQNNAGAAYELGTIYLDANVVEEDIALALRYLRASAFRGDVRAQFELGSIYDNGEAVPRDLSLASLWYFTASMRDDPGAEFNLASLYETGEGVEADPIMAHAYYSLAISHGFPERGSLALRELSSRLTARQKEQAELMADRIRTSRTTSFSLDRRAGRGTK